MENLNLDKKDFKILSELDNNFRQSFSKIGKSVGLSKNSVALRFSRLQELMSHNQTGINYLSLGYRMVKIFYSLTNYDDFVEKKIINEAKKNKNILWVARLFGSYDLEICFLVKDMDELIIQAGNLEEKIANLIDNKNILLIEKELFKKYSFLHESNKNTIQILEKPKKIIYLSNTEKNVLLFLRPSPRATILDIAEKSGLTQKTVSTNIKQLQNKGIILGFFLSLDLSKFNYEVYKLLIQIQNTASLKKFEDFLINMQNIKHFSKTLGVWDYELDIYAKNLNEIHNELTNIKNTFPKTIKRITILTHGKRLLTNKEGFLR
jgi:DNA-binding Lrp family transcriptional regulator